MKLAPLFRALLRMGLLLILAALLVLLDQWTKTIAEQNLDPGRPMLPVLEFSGLDKPVLGLVLVHNPGAFLGLGGGLEGPFKITMMIIIPLIAMAAIIFVLFRPFWKKNAIPVSPVYQVVLMFFLAGGFGNLIDRIARGTVTDFMNLGIGNLRSGIFNVADLYIVIAVLLVVLHTIVAGIKDRKKAKEPKPEA